MNAEGVVNDITLGEVFRKLQDMDERHTADLEELKTQTKLTNGRVNKHDVTLGILWWGMGLIGSVAMLALGAWLSQVFA